MMNKLRAELTVDNTRGICRVEVFDGEQCIASRIAHNTDELRQICEDFAGLDIVGLPEHIEEKQS